MHIFKLIVKCTCQDCNNFFDTFTHLFCIKMKCHPHCNYLWFEKKYSLTWTLYFILRYRNTTADICNTVFNYIITYNTISNLINRTTTFRKTSKMHSGKYVWLVTLYSRSQPTTASEVFLKAINRKQYALTA